MDAVDEVLKNFPYRLNIVFRARIDEDCFWHVMHEESVVVIVKAASGDFFIDYLNNGKEKSVKRAKTGVEGSNQSAR